MKLNFKQIHFKPDNYKECEYCGICSFEHIHPVATLPKDYLVANIALKDSVIDATTPDQPFKVGEMVGVSYSHTLLEEEIDDIVHDLEALDFNSDEAREIVRQSLLRFLRSSLISLLEEDVRRMEGEKKEEKHHEECLSTENSEAYCDCSSKIQLIGFNLALSQEIAYKNNQIEELKKMNNHKTYCEMFLKGWASSIPPRCTCDEIRGVHGEPNSVTEDARKEESEAWLRGERCEVCARNN